MISNYAPLLELYSFILMPLPDQGRKGSWYPIVGILFFLKCAMNG